MTIGILELGVTCQAACRSRALRGWLFPYYSKFSSALKPALGWCPACSSLVFGRVPIREAKQEASRESVRWSGSLLSVLAPDELSMQALMIALV